MMLAWAIVNLSSDRSTYNGPCERDIHFEASWRCYNLLSMPKLLPCPNRNYSKWGTLEVYVLISEIFNLWNYLDFSSRLCLATHISRVTDYKDSSQVIFFIEWPHHELFALKGRLNHCRGIRERWLGSLGFVGVWRLRDRHSDILKGLQAGLPDWVWWELSDETWPCRWFLSTTMHWEVCFRPNMCEGGFPAVPNFFLPPESAALVLRKLSHCMSSLWPWHAPRLKLFEALLIC